MSITLIIDGNATADGGTIEPGERRVQIGLVGSRVGWARIYPQGNRQHPIYSNAASQVTVTFPEGVYTVEANSPSGGPFVVPQQMTIRVVAPKPVDPPVVVDPPATDRILIRNLATARLHEGKRYRVEPIRHVVTQSVNVPNDCDIDATGATIVMHGNSWSPVWGINNRYEVSIVGGTYEGGNNTYIAHVNASSLVTIAEMKADRIGGGVLIRGSQSVAVENVTVTRVFHYLAFLEHHTPPNTKLRINNSQIQLINLRLSDGSAKPESGIRVHATNGLEISECTIICRDGKRTALRLHDGTDFSIRYSEFVGGVGFGPLSEGDGGREWGIVDWISTSGNILENQVTRPRNADDAATAQRRRDSLALRLADVRFISCKVEGAFTVNAGLSGLRIANCEVIDGKLPHVDSVFRKVVSRYPEEDKWTLPGDVLRPAPTGIIHDVRAVGLRLNPPKGFTVE